MGKSRRTAAKKRAKRPPPKVSVSVAADLPPGARLATLEILRRLPPQPPPTPEEIQARRLRMAAIHEQARRHIEEQYRGVFGRIMESPSPLSAEAAAAAWDARLRKEARLELRRQEILREEKAKLSARSAERRELTDEMIRLFLDDGGDKPTTGGRRPTLDKIATRLKARYPGVKIGPSRLGRRIREVKGQRVK
jgi:hypothetical protein